MRKHLKHYVIFSIIFITYCKSQFYYEWRIFNLSKYYSKENPKKTLDRPLRTTPPYRSMKRNHSIFKNVNKKICKECGGECCKNCGCHFSPDDFKEISFEFLKKEMEKGYISIDYVHGNLIFESSGLYILRIRNQGAPIVDLGYKRTPCILLTEKGCKLKYRKRPSGGKYLVPSNQFSSNKPTPIRKCLSIYTIVDCCYDWKPYQKILVKLTEYFQDKEIPCSI